MPSERDPDYAALVPGSEDPEAQSTPGVATGDATTRAPDPSLADTTGTGTIVALGCIGGTVFLIVLGLLYLLVTQLFG